MSASSNNPYSVASVPAGWDEVPCVQYGFPIETGTPREPKLRTVFEPVPDGAITASPIYLLTTEQYYRQAQFDTGYEVRETTSIATELEDYCEEQDRVLYPIHVESDTYGQETPGTLVSWFCEFVEDRLGVPFTDCTLYFSGNRSIHVHVPRFVHGETQRRYLKERAQAFCEETDANLDLGLYSPKGLFRLPGVSHKSTSLGKVPIQPEWNHTRIVRESASGGPRPDSYAEVLREVFGVEGRLIAPDATLDRDNPLTLFNWLDMEEAVLDLSPTVRTIETPLIEREESPADLSARAKWAMYNHKEFSPYAHADGNPRSVAVFRVKGGAFVRASKRRGATMVPGYFYGAVGCDPSYTKEGVYAPLQLSKRDYGKWNFQSGDCVVVIGGRSRNSILLEVGQTEARRLGTTLTQDGDDNREECLELLGELGYQTGGTGTENTSSSTRRGQRSESDSIWPARENPRSQAEALQLQAEQDGIQTLDRPEVVKVACKHLRYGWKPTWEWFEQQYGSDFDPSLTRRQLRSIVEGYPEYNHVEIPEE